MRICITRSERNSYSETFIRDQIAGFSKLAEVYTIHSGRLPERQEDGKLLSPWIFWILHKIVKGISGRRNNYFSHYGLKRYFRENRIDVVLANYGLSAAHLAPICRDLRIPLIVIFHGHDATDRKLLSRYANKYLALFASAASIVVVSADMKNRIMQLGANSEKVEVVPCGVDLLKFTLSPGRKEHLFLAVGRFVAKKGPLFTIQAFHQVWKKHPDATLVMIGAHKGLYEECLKLVISLGIQKAIMFPGILKQEAIRGFMSKALAFVQHSVTAPNGDMEGTPVSILEACATGLPVISTFHGGIRDAVVHEKTGFLVDEGDFSGMASYMMKLLERPDMAASMGVEGRVHMEAQYDQVKQIGKLYHLAVDAIERQKDYSG